MVIVSQIHLTKRIFHRDGIGYIDIPRTGSTSIRHMLGELGFVAETFDTRPDLHLFTIVRHPYPRLMSAVIGYANTRLLLGGHAPKEHVIDITNEVIKGLTEKTFRPLSEHMIPQVDYIEWEPDVLFRLGDIGRVTDLLAEYGFEGVLPHLQAAPSEMKALVGGMLWPYRREVVAFYGEDSKLWGSVSS